NGQVNLLQHVFRLASVIQYTEADAKKLRRGHVVDEAKRRPVAMRDTIECRGKLLALYVGIHAVRACEGLKTLSLAWLRGVSVLYLRSCDLGGPRSSSEQISPCLRLVFSRFARCDLRATEQSKLDCLCGRAGPGGWGGCHLAVLGLPVSSGGQGRLMRKAR